MIVFYWLTAAKQFPNHLAEVSGKNILDVKLKLELLKEKSQLQLAMVNFRIGELLLNGPLSLKTQMKSQLSS